MKFWQVPVSRYDPICDCPDEQEPIFTSYEAASKFYENSVAISNDGDYVGLFECCVKNDRIVRGKKIMSNVR